MKSLAKRFGSNVMAVKTAVNRVVEVQRKDGLIGGTLEAEITSYCDAELAQQLQKIGDELRFVLIASSVTIAPLSSVTECGRHRSRRSQSCCCKNHQCRNACAAGITRWISV